jgi:hypothetical protein
MLLQHATGIAELSVECPSLDWLEVFSTTKLHGLKDLKIRTSADMFAQEVYVTRLLNSLAHVASTIKHLDLGRKEDGRSRKRLNGSLPVSLKACAGSVQLKSLVLRDFRFTTSASAIDWTRFGQKRIERLSFVHCYGMGAQTLTDPYSATQTWSSLTRLDMVLPDHHLEENINIIRWLEDVLGTLSPHSLKSLRIEVPAADRFPNIETIARHECLESLVLGVTDTDGRWMVLKHEGLNMVSAHCKRLQCLGLSLPPLQACPNYLVRRDPSKFLSRPGFGVLTVGKRCLSDGAISTLLALSTAEMHPSPYAPAWVRHCPQSLGEGDEETIAAVVARTLRPEASATRPRELRNDLTVGIHAGAYYCKSWVDEQVIFCAHEPGVLRQVSAGNGPLSWIKA